MYNKVEKISNLCSTLLRIPTRNLKSRRLSLVRMCCHINANKLNSIKFSGTKCVKRKLFPLCHIFSSKTPLDI